MGDRRDSHKVLIDTECALCSATGAWVQKRDNDGRFHLHALQSDEGQALLEARGLPKDTRDTLVLIEQDRVYLRSTASLRIARHLSWPWPALYVMILVPKPIRDRVYRFVSRNRHRLRKTRTSS